MEGNAAELHPYNVSKKKRKFSWKKYGIYHLRWQSGFLLNTAIFYVCITLLGLPIWLAVIIFQFFGAVIYWELDKFIFNKLGNKK
jgi:hypothetical protein